MPPPITRHYARVADGRHVHYRRAGTGPPVVLVHQSPRSSAELEPVLNAWAEAFTVIAPDTPGNGHSEPLHLAEPGIADYADALALFLDALGQDRVGLYGFHTGASIVAAVARRHPGRVAHAVSNGFSLLSEAQKQDFLAHYLPPFVPDWSGSHLTWAWARLREQTAFFPWYDRRPETRLAMDCYTADQAQAQLMDLLRAGDAHRGPYAAAFSFDKRAILGQPMSAPLTIMAAPPDPLYAHLDRIDAVPAGVEIYRGTDPDDALREARDRLAAALQGADAAAPAAPPAPTRWGYLPLDAGQLHYAGRVDDGTRPTVVLPDLGGSARSLRWRLTGDGGPPVVALDPPGHGQSWSARLPVDLEACAHHVAQGLAAIGRDGVDLVCLGLSAALGAMIARARPDLIHRLTAIDCLLPAGDRTALVARYWPDLTPKSHGGHLAAAWRFVRGRHLYWPWFDERAGAALDPTPALETGHVHDDLTALLEADARVGDWARAAIMAIDDALFDAVRCPVRWALPPWAVARADLFRPRGASLTGSDADPLISILRSQGS